MKTPSQFDEWLQAIYEIADEEIKRIALPVGTYTAKTILTILSKQRIGYNGANKRLNSHDSNIKQAKQTETEVADNICILILFIGGNILF